MRKIKKLSGKSCRFVCAAFLICSLLLTGCSTARNVSDQTIPAESGSSEGKTDNTGTLATAESAQNAESTQAVERTQTAESTQAAENTQNTEITEPAENTQNTEITEPAENTQEMDDAAAASLTAFRQALVGTPQQFAAAYFGFAIPDGNMPADPYAVMEGAAPWLCDDLPFLLQIPEQNILGTDGHLFCIVPADENATVSVNWSRWDENTKTYGEKIVLYRSEKGEPILLMTTNTGWCMETEVIITDSSGEVTVWYPFIDEDNRIARLCDNNGASLYYDFSPYDQLNYENLTGGAPDGMVGIWELAWTEVEGDRVEAKPGGCTVEITKDGMDLFWLSYSDRNYPEDNFTDRKLFVSFGELYSGCGNNQWFAEVDTTSDELIRYAVTLLEDGTLLMQYSWEMDGMPWVSYGWYKKLG